MSDMISRADAIAAIQKQAGYGKEPWMQGNNSAIFACAATIRALPAREVGVRELDWVYGKAECEVGTYLVDSGWADHVGGKRWWAWVKWDGGGEADPFLAWQYGERCETEESAKAAAQADYAARIRSALTATPTRKEAMPDDTDCSVTAYAALARMKEAKE